MMRAAICCLSLGFWLHAVSPLFPRSMAEHQYTTAPFSLAVAAFVFLVLDFFRTR